MSNITEFIIPPAEPVGVATAKDWAAIEDRWGPIQKELKTLNTLFGVGAFDNFLWFFSPTSKNINLNLDNQITKQRASLAMLDDFELNINELIPALISDNGDLICITQEIPSRIIVIESRYSEVEFYDLTIDDFLAQLLSGALYSPIFPEDFPTRPTCFSPLLN